MNKNSRIYIVGHTGFIGGAVLANLRRRGYNKLIYISHKKLDLIDQTAVYSFFKRTRPQYVFLLAARVGGIHANNTYPAEFIYQNLAIQSNIMNAAYLYGTKRLIFPGSACMYPKNCPQPMKEEYLLSGPIEPTNEPFAVAKIAGIKIPATVYGPGDHFGPNGHVVSGLIERIHNAKITGKRELEVWGTGKPKREFIYIDDAADAMIFLMQTYNDNRLINIGTGIEVSIKQLAFLLKSIIGYKGEIIFDTTKPNGNHRRLLDSSQIVNSGWHTKTSLLNGFNKTYKWYLNTQKE
jgi:GDP-L-fucose synthase